MIVVIESLKEKDGKTGRKLRDDLELIAIAMSLGKNFKVHYKTARSADDLEFLLKELCALVIECGGVAPVVSRNSNEAIGQCASRLLDDPRRLVSPYTPLQCPHRFSLFSCCS
jgi:hypothetical protein